MDSIYFLQIICDFDTESHFENVYSTKELALKNGIIQLERLFRTHYEELFDYDYNNKSKAPSISRKELFNLQGIYDFTITEYDPKYVDSLENIENLLAVTEYDLHNNFCAKLEPAKIQYSYDYNGRPEYITAIYIFNFNGKITKSKVTMSYADYINPKAGTKFKIGDIVKIKKGMHCNYDFCDKLHVVVDTPHKLENQRFFDNTYRVIVNHSSYNEGCHVEVLHENELEKFEGTLPYDSPILFLSKLKKGEIKLENVSWSDIECGHIALNENKSFRDVPEIMEQLKQGEEL